MSQLLALLRELEAARFYGAVEIKFEAGCVVLIRKSETIKTTNDCRDSRGAKDVANNY